MSRTFASADLRSYLKQHFGFEEFQECQEDAVAAALRGEHSFVNVATGGGKSLCYQLSACILEGITVVVSPLIALMHDQVDSMDKRGVAATYIDSTLNEADKAARWKEIQRGKIKLVYVSPEALATKAFGDQLEGKKIALLVVDEAHCISEWGHDFRRDYLAIPAARKRLGNPPVMALTATAPVHVKEDILRSLEIEDATQILGEIDRHNLVLDVVKVYSEGEKYEWLTPKLKEHTKKGQKCVVYCQTVRAVKALYEHFSTVRGVSCGMYHGKMEGAERGDSHTKLRDGITPVLFATKAFGMGVDIPDIRYVYHYDMPGSLEAYWQEVGRAGRDGHRSWCTLLFQPHDVRQLRRFIAAANPKLSYIETVWRNLTSVMKPWQWREDLPSRNYNEEYYLKGFCGDDEGRLALTRASLAALVEHGLVKIFGGTMQFLMTPDQIKKFGFPISEKDLDHKRDCAIQRLKIMIYFAYKGADNQRRIIMDHFRFNRIVEEVKDMDIDAWYQIEPDTLKAMLKALIERDIRESEFAGYLGGRNDVKGPSAGTLKKLNSRELRMDVSQAQTLGYIRALALEDRTFLTVTKKGLAVLSEAGVETKPAATYTELKASMHSPINLKLLRDALDGFRSYHSGTRGERWWPKLEELLSDGFDVLDRKQISGLHLVSDFVHKNPTYVKNSGRSATSGKKKTGVLLKDVKFFLNYLFDNLVET